MRQIMLILLTAMALTVAAASATTDAEVDANQSSIVTNNEANQLHYSVRIDGDLAIVGAEWHDDFKGAAYILKRTEEGWSEMQKLSPSDLGRFDHFGSSVSISGDYAVVATTWQNLFAGAVYVFKYADDEWVFQQKISLDDSHPDDRFGRVVRINGDEITITTALSDSHEAGLAYRFRRTGDLWTLERMVDALATAALGSQSLTIDGPSANDLLTIANHLAVIVKEPPVRPLSAADEPEWVNASDATFEDRVEVTWDNSTLDAIIYRILRNDTLISVASSEDSLYLDRTGRPDEVYNYCVAVMDMYGVSTDSICDPGSRIIFAPMDVSASDGDFDLFVRVTWTDLSMVEAGYLIVRDSVELATVGANAWLYDDTTAEAMDTCFYEVIAVDADDYQSQPVGDDGFRGTILPPVGVTASDGEYSEYVAITWIDQAENDTGFYIYRDTVFLDSVNTGIEHYEDYTAVNGEEYEYCVATRGAESIESIWRCDMGGIGILPAPAWVEASDSTFDDRIQVTWDDPSDLEDGFEILRDGAVLDTARANVTIYKDFTAIPDSAHVYCVVAFNDNGGKSDTVCDSGVRSLVLAPSEVTATKGDFEDRVAITWISSSTTAVLFKVFRDGVFIKSAAAGSRAYSDYKGTAGQEYDYSVVAVTSLAVESDATIDTGHREVLAPTEMTASDGEPEDRIVVSWTDNSQIEDGYIIYRNGDSLDLNDRNITSFDDYETVPGSTYTYSVVAFDSIAFTAQNVVIGYSDMVADTGRRVLLPPTGVQVSEGKYEDRIEITWIDNSKAEDGYRIYRISPVDTIMFDTLDNFTSYWDYLSEGAVGQTYQYEVEAYDDWGESVRESGEGSTTVLAPVSFNASDVYEDRIELTWVDVSNVNTGYVIQRDGFFLATTDPNVTSLTDDSSLSLNRSYDYSIHAVCGAQSSDTVYDQGRCVSPADDDIFTIVLDDTIHAEDADTVDWFGRSVAVSGDFAVIGAPYDDDKGEQSGSAYIFEHEGGEWVQKQKLEYSAYEPGYQNHDYFGYAVDISGDVAAVGVFNHGRYLHGQVEIFERNYSGEWEFVKDVYASPLSHCQRMGYSVAVSDCSDFIIAGGHPNWSDTSIEEVAFIFERDGDGNWPSTQTVVLHPYPWMDGETHSFGQSVAIDDNLAVVGAPLSPCSPDSSLPGKAYLFQRQGTWQYLATFYPDPHPDSGSFYTTFGKTVAIDGDVIVVGCNSGPIHVFERNSAGNWPQNATARLTPSDQSNVGGSGRYIDISGDIVIVGDHREGCAYLFVRNADGSWPEHETAKLGARDSDPYDYFGSSVAIDGCKALVGAHYAEDGVRNSGLVYAFETCVPPGEVEASDGSLNSRVRIRWTDRSDSETRFEIYRDGEPLDNMLPPNTEVYEDFDAMPGIAYEYTVASYSDVWGAAWSGSDFGWRPPNGAITGQVSTIAGTGVDSVRVSLDPPPTQALMLDGSGGHVRIPDPDGTLNLGTSDDFTIEAWIKYSGVDVQTMIAKGGSAQFPFRLSSDAAGEKLKFIIGGCEVLSEQSDLNDDTWHHVACVHDAGTTDNKIAIYVDSVFTGWTFYSNPGTFTNDDDLLLGGGYSTDSWFGGQMDEVRIWSVARDSTEIVTTIKQPLTGDEENLMAYWPLDEGGGTAIIDLTDGEHYGVVEGGVYWTANAAPLNTNVFTDSQGNFVVDNIRYGDGTSFEVRPHAENRQFSPVFKMITLENEHPVENQVNFIDISQYTVSGMVWLGDSALSDCRAANVEIHVDGQMRATTDKNGKFSMALGPGKYTIGPVQEGHGFDTAYTLTVASNISDLMFRDTTMRTLALNVGNGCGGEVGTLTIDIYSQNGCFVDSLESDATLSVSLAPQKYLLSAKVDRSTVPSELDDFDVEMFFENLGWREIDLTDSSKAMDFIYRAPPEVTIEWVQSWPTCVGLTYNGNPLANDSPITIIPQGELVDIVIHVYEGPIEDGCKLDSGTVIIYDEIFDLEDSVITLQVTDGEAAYTSFACTPSLIVGRTDSKGNDRSFQKAFKATAFVEGRPPKTATAWALVTGHVAPEGSDFITATTTDQILYILRDPPGDGSSAYLEEGKTLRWTVDYDKFLISEEIGLEITIKSGVKAGWFLGLGAGTTGKAKYEKVFETKLMGGTSYDSIGKSEITLTTNERFSTSSSDVFVGERGDVFVGKGNNFIFSEVGVVEVDLASCTVERSTSVGFEPEACSTVFVYTQQYIEEVLIPEYEAKIDTSTGLSAEEVIIFEAHRDNWLDILAMNRALKQDARLERNLSFSAGVDYSYTHDSTRTGYYQRSLTILGDLSGALGSEVDVSGGVSASFAMKIPFQAHTESVVYFEEATGDTTQGIGFTLIDDDAGDHYTVDVKFDEVYPTPVFDVRAGASSCPYEPWPNPAPGPDYGKARMVPRDKVSALPQTDMADLADLPPDEPAVFTLLITNESGTDEPREYGLRELTTSNPGGAVLKANGVPILNGINYYLNPYQGYELTMTVQRGPTKYRYEDLAVLVYSPCEWDHWKNGGPMRCADTVRFTVQFDAPCTDIRLAEPQPGWAYALQDTGSPLEMTLTEYDSVVGEDNVLDWVGVQYRRAGTDERGPSDWMPMPTVSPGPEHTTVWWHLPDNLPDGVYELRAFSECTRGQGYSVASKGTIDRHVPVVFGTPEPSDRELSLGEDISITFNEPIDCSVNGFDSLITLTYLDGPSVGKIETVCDGSTIIIAPTEDVDPDDLEGRKLEAHVAGVCDLVGNPMSGEATWWFTVRQSVFTWSKMNLTEDVAFRSPGSISAELVNGSDTSVGFSIITKPSWITAVAPETGSIAPGGKQIISFTIQEEPDLALGIHEGEVRATSSQGQAVLNVYLTVSCHEPTWSLDPGKYEHSMTIVAEVSIDGNTANDPDDRVAAFVGAQLRGVANVEPGIPNSKVVFLTVYSNRTSGETVRFQVWDDDQCQLYNSTSEHYAFVSNGMIGSPNDPVPLTAADVLLDSVQVIPLSQGWNWFSTYVTGMDMSADGVLSDLTPAVGDILKSQTAFAQFDPGMGWVGSLQLLDNVSGYMVKLSEPGNIIQEGSVVDPLTTLVQVVDGWNWVGYLPDGPIEVDEALQELNAILDSGDMVRSQYSFSQFVNSGNDVGWYGDLKSMEPGEGYKLYLGNGSEAGDGFRYPSYKGASPTSPPVVSEQVICRKTETVEGLPAWTVSQNAYQYNMTVIARLNIEGSEGRSDNDVIGAFVDGECRGIARPIHLSATDQYAAFLMIHSNEAIGESVNFQVFVPESRMVYNVAEVITYEADAAAGTVREPLVLRTSGVAFEVPVTMPNDYSLSQNYPNPFNPVTIIRYNLPAPGEVTLSVYNILGQKVRTLVSGFVNSGPHEAIWNGRDEDGQPVSTGVYLYRIESGEFSQTKKMILIK